MKNLLESINDRLEKIEIEAPETISYLRKQIEKLKFAKYGLSECRDILFENDALKQCEEIEKYSIMWEEIRDLQCDISTQYCDCIYD